MTKSLKLAIALLLSGLSTNAMAQTEAWEGSWTTTYGDIRLIEDGNHVYGDYGTWGTIQGVLSSDKQKLRGIYTRNDDGTSGYIEWIQSGDDGNRFAGRWRAFNAGPPIWDQEDGGTKWRGDRRSETRPTLTVFRGVTQMNSFLARASSQYRSWVAALNRPPAQASTAAARNATATPRRAPPARHKYADKIPAFAAFAPDFNPTWVEVKIGKLSMQIDELGTYELFGLAGLYAYCETPSGARKLAPYYSAANNVMDRPRGSAQSGPIMFRSNEGVRRFALDESCLATSGGRLSFQMQSNLAEKDTIPQTDDKFGYRSWKFYLEDLPQKGPEKKFGLNRLSDTKWSFRNLETIRKGHFRGSFVVIDGTVTVGR